MNQEWEEEEVFFPTKRQSNIGCIQQHNWRARCETYVRIRILWEKITHSLGSDNVWKKRWLPVFHFFPHYSPVTPPLVIFACTLPILINSSFMLSRLSRFSTTWNIKTSLVLIFCFFVLKTVKFGPRSTGRDKLSQTASFVLVLAIRVTPSYPPATHTIKGPVKYRITTTTRATPPFGHLIIELSYLFCKSFYSELYVYKPDTENLCVCVQIFMWRCTQVLYEEIKEHVLTWSTSSATALQWAFTNSSWLLNCAGSGAARIWSLICNLQFLRNSSNNNSSFPRVN